MKSFVQYLIICMMNQESISSHVASYNAIGSKLPIIDNYKFRIIINTSGNGYTPFSSVHYIRTSRDRLPCDIHNKLLYFMKCIINFNFQALQ